MESKVVVKYKNTTLYRKGKRSPTAFVYVVGLFCCLCAAFLPRMITDLHGFLSISVLSVASVVHSLGGKSFEIIL